MELARRSARRLILLSLLLSLYALTHTCAVNVGDAETRVRLLDANDDDFAVGCPNVTTLAVYDGTASTGAKASNISAQIVDSDTCERSTVVSAKQVQEKDSSGVRVFELDVRKRGIRRVVGIPSGVRILRLENNTVESFRPGRSAMNATTHIYLSNNSIESLDDFIFPASLLTLDLTDNAIESIENVSLPTKLAMLNLTLNPIESLQFATLPPKLQHLNVAGGSLDTLQNFSFPSSLVSLNFSGNPITRIAGVIFPAALDRLVINAGYSSSSATSTASASIGKPTGKATATAVTAASTPLLFAQEVTRLEEFEVRRTDAERFQKLQLFDVSPTANVKCSDPLAKHFFVNDTMLCVLSDDDFVAKYASVAEAAAIADGTVAGRKNGAQSAKELPLLHETWRQSRSWFLVVSGALLTGLVVMIGICSCCHSSVRRVNGAYTSRKSELAKSRSALAAAGKRANASGENALAKSEKETESLLWSSQDEMTDESAAAAEHSDGDGAPYSDSLDVKLDAFLITPSLLEFPASLPHTTLTERKTKSSNQQTTNGSQFDYALASLKNQVVVLKTLSILGATTTKRIEFAGGRAGRVALRQFSREIQLHAMVSHANVVSFIGYLRGGPFGQRGVGSHRDHRRKSLTLVTEYMNVGTLDNFINAQKVQLQEALILQRTAVEEHTEPYEDGRASELSLDMHEPSHAHAHHYQLWDWHRDSLPAKSKLSVAIDIARALEYLHSFSPSLVHGNLSSRRVLLDDSWQVKLSDLSCCSALLRWSERHQNDGISGSSSGSRSSHGDTQDDEVQMDMTVWTAPEVIDGQQCTTKADMYSFGILLSYLDTYEFPVDALHRVDSEVAILSSSNYHAIPLIGARSLPMAIRMLTMQCLSFQPEDRPSADEALSELLSIQMDLREMSSSSELAD